LPGLAELALSTAPVFGSALLVVAAGQFKGPDYRSLIEQHMELVDRLPPEVSPSTTHCCGSSALTAAISLGK
jgi:hypothetical protein